VTEGAPAPDFTLPSTSGESVTLSRLRGRNVLLAFFPAAFTGVCTEELCALSDDFDRFEGADTVALPISVDNLPSLREFKAKERMQVELLSDLKREVSRSYGVLDEERFVARRAYVLVDRQGIVRWRFTEDTPGSRRENAELLRRIEALS
jgi:peroxiredoxin